MRLDCSILRGRLNVPFQERGTYPNWWSAILAFIGYSVGLGNFWRFPYLCFKHEGATFLIPYVMAMLCIGIPIYFMELALGQYVSLGPIQLFMFISPIFSGIGYSMVLILFVIAIYYNVILAWTIFYIGAGAAFNAVLPWADCNHEHMPDNCSDYQQGHLVAARFYYHHIVLDQPIGEEVDDGSNEVNGRMVICLAVSWLLIAVCLAGGIRNTRKVLLFTVFYPYIMLSLILAWNYDNSEEAQIVTSQSKFFRVNSTYLMTQPEVWNDAATQVIYSLGISYGGIITLSSYNKLHQNILRDTFIVCLLDAFTSIFCAFVVFSISGYLSEDFLGEKGSSSVLVFIAFPALVSRMGSRGLWSLLFFIMIFALGFDTQLMMVETVTTSLFDEFHFLRRRYIPVVVVVCFIMFLLGVPMTMQKGKQIFDLLDAYTSMHSLLLLGLLEVIVVTYVYGFKKMMMRVKVDLKVWIPGVFYFYLAVTWMLLTPLSLLVLLCFSLYGEYKKVWEHEKKFDILFISGVVISFSAFAILPLRAIYVVCKKYYEGGLSKKTLSQLWLATTNFCPEFIRNDRDPNVKNPNLPESMSYMETST